MGKRVFCQNIYLLLLQLHILVSIVAHQSVKRLPTAALDQTLKKLQIV